jgi:glycosyltransferase involved in cell wall biosynthesis
MLKADVPLVTVVTPALNAASSLGMCLASVATQTYPRIEHVVIDGGSTDGTIDVIRSFADRRSVSWISEPDRGMYDAVNKGLSRAHGDVLAYLNADDVYLPWSVDVAVRTLASGVDFCYGDLGVLRGRKQKSFMPNFYPAFDLNIYAFFLQLAQPTVFWRRSAYDRLGGFDDSFRLVADCDYWLRAGVSGCSFRHVSELLAVQFDHGETLRNRFRADLKEELERIQQTYRGAIGPPEPYGRFRMALEWRAQLVQFCLSYRHSRPERWSRFLSWLKANEMAPDWGVLSALLPASMWRERPSLLDGDRFLRVLRTELSRGSLGDVVGPLQW